jgi:Flp pilus assembly protein CpaB
LSRRARAVAFLALAAGLAALAAVVANGYGSSLARSFGPLRDVVVASRDMPAGVPIGRAELSHSLEIRRIPARFIPPGALSVPQEALGQEPAIVLPAGSYLIATQLRSPAAGHAHGRPQLAHGRRPVEIAISGGGALLATGGSPDGSKVDVVVITEPRGPGPGHTYVAAAGVRLLALTQQDPAGPGPALGWSATLALTRDQALELIEAESFARGVRLLPRPGS